MNPYSRPVNGSRPRNGSFGRSDPYTSPQRNSDISRPTSPYTSQRHGSRSFDPASAYAERKKNAVYQAKHQPGAAPRASGTFPPRAHEVDKRAVTIQWVVSSYDNLLREWNACHTLPSITDTKMRSLLGQKVLGSDVSRQQKIVKCVINGETIWLPLRAVKFYNTNRPRGS